MELINYNCQKKKQQRSKVFFVGLKSSKIGVEFKKEPVVLWILFLWRNKCCVKL
ncbi:MAG: hypothetical protein PARBA_03133 [Parabacteroides sp.]